MIPRDDACEAYRRAWMAWMVCVDESAKQQLEGRMDVLQPSIAPYADHPDWQSFRDSLPLYNEYWAGLVGRGNAAIEALKELARRGGAGEGKP